MRLTEIYTSTQGEGPRVGKPTTFVRFAGCNYRCPGWACDTPFAIYPEHYRDKWYQQTVEDIVEDVRVKGATNVCLTGGEPMLQNTRELEELIEKLSEAGHEVEMFTNMSQLYTTAILAQADLIMDWKLPGSGEGSKDIPARVSNLQKIERESTEGRHSVKFVCKNMADVDVAIACCNDGVPDYGVNIYFGVVWGQEQFKEKDLVEILLKQIPGAAWRLNVQVHNFLWPAQERAR